MPIKRFYTNMGPSSDPVFRQLEPGDAVYFSVCVCLVRRHLQLFPLFQIVFH